MFVQFEFPWVLGPEPGRYTIREWLGEPPAHILVLHTLGAAERRLLPRRRRRREAPAEPSPAAVATSRATLVDAAALESREAAERRLREEDPDALADAAVLRLNRLLHAHRVARADPYVRVGYGDGERVADGRWDRALELPAAPRRGARGAGRRLSALRPQERLAALLAGRDVALACEELALRARSDVDAGRLREAALQLAAAFEAALAELEPWRDDARLGEALAELRARSGEVADAAAAALRGGLDDEHVVTVRAALARLEAALRARTAGGL
ncbi:MAG TPA: hypothetical protein VM299_05050 [Solirubrobacteraceae bacterium]|nr:hypothetical protein [Solirubrobacteraceae bacterium]